MRASSRGSARGASELAKLSFDPTRAKYFGIVKERLGLVDREVAMLRENGFVAVDPGTPLTFGTAYHQLYIRDLPVLVTTDSILHAVHRSYDRILMEVEASWFAPAIGELLAACHAALAAEARGERPGRGRPRRGPVPDRRPQPAGRRRRPRVRPGAGPARAPSIGPSGRTGRASSSSPRRSARTRRPWRSSSRSDRWPSRRRGAR